MRLSLIVFLLLNLLVASCDQITSSGKEEVDRIDEYYDVYSLMDRSAEALQQMDVALRKVALFGGEREESTIELDSAAVVRELEVFRQASINEPVLSGRYSKVVEQQNGLQVVTYEADDKESLNINYLKVYQHPKTKQVERLEALFSNRNILYNSTRLLRVEYGSVGGRHVPLSYTIDGVQKMIFSDKKEYRLEGEFVYNL